ncbi:DUF4388 domain-containing protein [Streptomyces europaeiscabiei]|uniref:DUF4388 domain-containing protein n=1 Tax=Streptomyces europaeiscabiei TaxID=146819 RepID=A0ABU4NC55_9ACTN|nr:DUF4388 domain-containing protein [Streptomyces europaeiscabiei]MDX2526052.1 DUF4388 domain-containing protein [Streptomyces europaeiscabiei]MDX2764299.1 DUF4388 domain-containing protein [Streptomyces europaeiscabiei]MDX2773916.1 DUF4388 domain-containing protein [Streptomyces europaeiscabiei]MDX3543397.1 DUF4388 domain-containing protein [Streptomyces europaeiscabiei]MDX3553213.1 DUF4388 domain-containing protein [Streptomyces europaeiscabiei]
MKTPSARNVPALLQALHQEGHTGTVRVSGAPGGTIHLRDGLIGAIETPGAPTATSTLLASGRIDDDAWLAASAAEPDADRLDLHLAAAGLIGAAELEVVCTAAVFDGAFAMALSPPGGWELTARQPTLLARPGVEPRPLAEETTRRMALLTRLWGPAGELARARPEPVSGHATPEHDGRLTRRHRDLVESVNGRRTPRDIAFARGRGLYAVMLDLIRLESLQAVRWETRTEPDSRPSTAPRIPQGHPVSDEPSPRAGPLPRRRPGGGSPSGDLGAKDGQ